MAGPENPHAKLAAILARPGVSDILSILNDGGEQARIIGGAVRNALLDEPVADIDIATTALPEIVMARAAESGMRPVPTGIEHGTVTIVADGIPYEVTTLRHDIETDGRRAKVRFGRDFRADALRRDFTINALSVDAGGHIHDDTGGLDDLAARRIRFIGDADQRIREDYLRILRFFRFSAAYGAGRLDPDGLAAAVRHREGMARLSRERIRQEMMKLLVAPGAPAVLQAMADAGILAPVLGGPGDIAAFTSLTALENRYGLAPSVIRRLMALTIRSADDIERLRATLRLTNRESAHVESVLAAMMEIGVGAAIPAVIHLYGKEGACDGLILHAAITSDDIRDRLALALEWNTPRFVLTGKDVIALGIARGPDVSRLLGATQRAWLQAGLPPDEETQRAILRQTIAAG